MIQSWDYRREYDELRDEILAAVDGVFRSGRLVLADSVRRLEGEFSTWCGADFGVGVNSGTDALIIALEALGIGKGDEVLTVANTAVPTVAAIVATGAVPVFVDVDAATGLMDPAALKQGIGPLSRAIIPVHLYGQCCDMDSIMALAHHHGLRVVEDCAQSTGADVNGRRCGTLADLAAFSFYPTKVLGAYGDGGMVVTTDSALANSARSLRMYGMSGAYFAETQGHNSRLDEVQAAILSVKLAHLDRWIERRRVIARRYDERLAGLGLGLPGRVSWGQHVWHLYVVRHPDRDRIMSELAKHGLKLAINYPHPIPAMPAYRRFGGSPGMLPVSELWAREVFSLPIYPTMTDDEQDRVCDLLESVLG